MSLPQIQFQLSGRPVLLAGSTGTLLNGRSIARACRPVLATTLSDPLDVLQPGCIGGNSELTMSAGNASLGHACVSPASDADQKATGEFAGVGQPFSVLGKGSADGRTR